MNAAVVTGASASLNCSSDDETNLLRWWHAYPGNVEKKIYTGSKWTNNFTFSEMYTVVHGNNEKTHHLKIKTVNETIAGTYTCQEPGLGLRSSAELIVLGEWLNARDYLYVSMMGGVILLNNRFQIIDATENQTASEFFLPDVENCKNVI